MIESTLPDATRDSGSLRRIEMLRLAGGLGWRVTLLPDDGRVDVALAARLARSEYKGAATYASRIGVGVHGSHGEQSFWGCNRTDTLLLAPRTASKFP